MRAFEKVLECCRIRRRICRSGARTDFSRMSPLTCDGCIINGSVSVCVRLGGWASRCVGTWVWKGCAVSKESLLSDKSGTRVVLGCCKVLTVKTGISPMRITETLLSSSENWSCIFPDVDRHRQSSAHLENWDMSVRLPTGVTMRHNRNRFNSKISFISAHLSLKISTSTSKS